VKWHDAQIGEETIEPAAPPSTPATEERAEISWEDGYCGDAKSDPPRHITGKQHKEELSEGSNQESCGKQCLGKKGAKGCMFRQDPENTSGKCWYFTIPVGIIPPIAANVKAVYTFFCAKLDISGGRVIGTDDKTFARTTEGTPSGERRKVLTQLTAPSFHHI
jgi:hypothetical protein